MATKAPGTTLSYLTTYDSVADVVLIGKLKSIGEQSVEVNMIDVSTLDSTGGYKEYIPGMKDTGVLALEGVHLKTDTGQELCRTLLGTGATGYYWITFPDGLVVVFTAYIVSHGLTGVEVDGAIGFKASLKVTGIIQIFNITDAVAQTVTVGSIDETMNSLATVLTGTPTYQWYSCDDASYTNPSAMAGKTSATCEVPTDLSVGTTYYYCAVAATGYRAINSQVHVITAEAA